MATVGESLAWVGKRKTVGKLIGWKLLIVDTLEEQKVVVSEVDPNKYQYSWYLLSLGGISRLIRWRSSRVGYAVGVPFKIIAIILMNVSIFFTSPDVSLVCTHSTTDNDLQSTSLLFYVLNMHFSLIVAVPNQLKQDNKKWIKAICKKTSNIWK